MKRLIDANLMALNESEAYMSAQTKIESPITLGLNSVVHRKIQQLIADTPTVDAVEVVRCKDCIGQSTWFKDAETGCEICGMSGMYPKSENGYCSYGLRRSDEE